MSNSNESQEIVLEWTSLVNQESSALRSRELHTGLQG